MASSASILCIYAFECGNICSVMWSVLCKYSNGFDCFEEIAQVNNQSLYGQSGLELI